MKPIHKLPAAIAAVALLLSGAPSAHGAGYAPDKPYITVSVDAPQPVAGSPCELTLSLESDGSFLGFQADLTLPAGMTPATTADGKPAVSLPQSLAQEGFTIVSNLLTDGTLRLALFSLNHAAIPAGAVTLLTITADTSVSFRTGEVRLSSILLTDADHRDTAVDDASRVLTAAPAQGDGSLSISPLSVEPGDTALLPLFLSSERAYYGLQTEISLPRGLKFQQKNGEPAIVLSEALKARGFTTASNLTAEGTLRLALFSLTRQPLPADDYEPLLTVSVRADAAFDGGEVTLSDILLTNAAGDDETLPAATTSVEVIIPANSFFPEPLTIRRGETGILSLALDNETPFTAFQTDITFPEGLTPDTSTVRLTDRGGENHTVSVSRRGEDTIRVVVFSAGNEPFAGESGTILTMEVTADSALSDGCEITTAGTLFSTARAREYRLPDASAEVTINDLQVGVESIDRKGKQNSVTFDLQGRRHREADPLTPGIYIQNGKKVIVR